MREMVLKKSDFQKVFAAPELSIDNDTDMASNWLLNHEHKEPSQRVRTALKNVTNNGSIGSLLYHYIEQIRTQILALDFENKRQAERTRRFFMFPLHFLTLDDYEINYFMRALDALLRYKSEKHFLDDNEFAASIGLDTSEYINLANEKYTKAKIESFAGIWDRSFAERLDNDELAQRELGNLRIREIFDMVQDYPNSSCALRDLRQYLDPSQRLKLVNEFIQSCNRKLLHAGTNTNDIILCYISTIKSFFLIDPRGVLLDNASRPIRKYLKEREDTIPNIVHALMTPSSDPKLSHLSEELAENSEAPIDDLHLHWNPDPIDALPDFKKQDIIESLISIFDTKEDFVAEFAEVFSRLLLSLKSFDITDIRRKLKLLKLKFGESEFHRLDVMVKDISDSKLLNMRIHERDNNLAETFKWSILSYMYWPELPQEEFKFPQNITNQLEIFEENYRKISPGRKIKAVNAGVVIVDLQLNDRNLVFDVTPDKAVVIYAFDGVDSLTQNDIMEKLNMESSTALNALNFWVKQGILKFEDDTYTVLETQEVDVSITSVPADIFSEKVEENDHWPFVVGMLTNLGPLSAERIHSMLKLTLPSGRPMRDTADVFGKQLDSWVNEGKLTMIDGKYSTV